MNRCPGHLRDVRRLLFPLLWALGPVARAAERSTRRVLDHDGYLLQMLSSLFVVLALIGAAAWLLRRMARAGAGAGGVLRIRAGLHLGGRERLVLVEAGGKHLLLGVAPGRVQTLHVFDAPPVEIPAEEPSGFARRLNAALRGGRAT